LNTLHELATALANDANFATNIKNRIALKASMTYLDCQLALTANELTTYTKTEVDTAVGLKANQTATYTKTESDTALGLKANQSTTYTKTEVDCIFLPKSDNTYVDGQIALKAN
ncbi:MAG: hypothetical protein ACKPKO_09605, partial [Candidatus Fonsibacter sp.]